MNDVKFVEVDGQKFVDDGNGQPKVDTAGNPIPFVEEKTVPYSRFKEVNDKMNELAEQIKSLTEKKDAGTISPDEKKELEAKQYLEKITRESLTKIEQEKKDKETEELKAFEKNVNELLEIHSNVKRDDFLKFLEEEGDDFSTLDSAMKHYLKNSEKKETDKAKKPSLPSNEGGGSRIEAVDDGKKSLRQISEEIIRSIGKGK